jgi:hypothetical protein
VRGEDVFAPGWRAWTRTRAEAVLRLRSPQSPRCRWFEPGDGLDAAGDVLGRPRRFLGRVLDLGGPPWRPASDSRTPPSPTPAASTRRPMIPLRRDQTDQTERTAAARNGFPPAPRTAPNGTPGRDRKPAPADRHCDLNRGGIRAATHSHAEKRALDHRVKGTRSQLMRTLTRRLARSLKSEGKPLKSYSESSPSRTVEAPIGRFEVVQQLCLFH